MFDWFDIDAAATVADFLGIGVEGANDIAPVAIDAVAEGGNLWNTVKDVAGAVKPITNALKATINTPYGASSGGAQRVPLQQIGGNMMPINGNGGARSGQAGQSKTTSYEEWKSMWDRRMAALAQANNDAGLGSTISRNRTYRRRISK